MPSNPPPDDPIKTCTPFTLSSSQKDNIDAILDEQVLFYQELWGSTVSSLLGDLTWFKFNLDP